MGGFFFITKERERGGPKGKEKEKKKRENAEKNLRKERPLQHAKRSKRN
jgi:hypothetical protein